MNTPASAAKTGPRIRVMLVDDSAVVRGFLVRILESDPSIEIVATCSNGQMAIMQVGRTRPDVVILDIEMPVMDGLTALPKILAVDPGARVLMASTLTQRNAEISLEALQRGATDYIPKPTANQLNGSDSFRRDLLTKIAALGRRSDAAAFEKRATGPAPKTRASTGREPKILAIGSSTGGPQALLTVLKALPRDVGVPVVIAQHMPPMFTMVLAQHIATASGRPSQEAVHGGPILPGHIYVAPGDNHLELARDGTNLVARLTKAPPENFCRPSVNPLFRSVAQLFGPQAVTLMLTGMGSDGLDGTRAIATAGGTVIAQDEATSVVWGMPGAIANAGLCNAVLPLTGIASYLGTLFAGSSR